MRRSASLDDQGVEVFDLAADGVRQGVTTVATRRSQQELYLMVDDADAFADELDRRGIEVASPVSDQGWARLLSFRLPSGAELSAYESRHALAHSLPD